MTNRQFNKKLKGLSFDEKTELFINMVNKLNETEGLDKLTLTACKAYHDLEDHYLVDVYTWRAIDDKIMDLEAEGVALV